MSSDGLITEPNEGARHPLGEDPGRLHDWMFDRRTEADSEVLDECHAGTGAVVMGKRMFDVGAGPWGDPPPFRKPVFVVTHEPREPLSKHGGTTYIFASDGIEAALEQARAAAGEKNVGIWGHEPNAATDLRFRTTYEN
jgi:dihydrofolate reductase